MLVPSCLRIVSGPGAHEAQFRVEERSRCSPWRGSRRGGLNTGSSGGHAAVGDSPAKGQSYNVRPNRRSVVMGKVWERSPSLTGLPSFRDSTDAREEKTMKIFLFHLPYRQLR